MPTRQQGAGKNWSRSMQPLQKAKNSCVFTTTETQRSKGFFSHWLPILHLPFPSQPCGHKGSSISVNRIKSSIDPASHSILQDTPSCGPNKASKPLNLAISAQLVLLPVLCLSVPEEHSVTKAEVFSFKLFAELSVLSVSLQV